MFGKMRWLVAVLALLCLPMPLVAKSKVAVNVDQAVSERLLVSGGKLDSEVIEVRREFPSTSAAVGVTGGCTRVDANGRFTGNHKVSFEVGIPDWKGTQTFKSHLRNGRPDKVWLWDVTDRIPDLVALGYVYGFEVYSSVKVHSSSFKEGDRVSCFVAVVEGDGSLVSAGASARERKIALQEAARATIYRGYEVQFE